MSRDNPNRKRVFIGKLNPEARARDLERFFKDNGFSRVKDVNMKLGYAFVEFEDKRDCDDAVYELNKRDFFGSRITVEHATGTPKEDLPPRERDRYDRGGGGGRYDGGRDRGGGGGGGYRDQPRYARQRPYNTEWRLIVTNLSSKVGWQDLKDYFRAAGEVTFTQANKERMNEGVVEFRSHRIMKKAIEKFDNTDFFGRKIKIIDDSPGPPRSRSRSKHRSRSRSKNRSRSRSASRSRRRSRSASARKSKSKSRSRSPVAKRDKSRTRSPAAKREKSRSRSPATKREKSRSRSPATKREKSRSRSPAAKREKSGSRSPSPKREKSGSRSPSPERKKSRSSSPAEKREKSRSSSPAPKREKSGSRSPAKEKSKSRSKSRSRSKSADMKGEEE